MAFGEKKRELTEDEKCADEARARAKAAELLAARELCSAELYKRLCRRFTQRAAAAAVADMTSLGYVDDARYAEVCVHSLVSARKSRRAAADTLRRRGLDEAVVSAAIEAAYAADEDGRDPEADAAAELIRRHYRSKLAAGRGDLVTAALLRRGFGCGTAIKAVKAAEAEFLAAEAE